MAERMLAKKYLRSLGTEESPAVVPRTEAGCVARLITEHRMMSANLVGAKPKTWFGRMLWKLFGRWL